MSEFLKQEDFLEHAANEYDIEVILNFLKENDVTVNEFRYLGRCADTCQACEGNDFNIWRDEDVLYDEASNHFIMVSDNETIETVDFSIYICNECGKWSTYIE